MLPNIMMQMIISRKSHNLGIHFVLLVPLWLAGLPTLLCSSCNALCGSLVWPFALFSCLLPRGAKSFCTSGSGYPTIVSLDDNLSSCIVFAPAVWIRKAHWFTACPHAGHLSLDNLYCTMWWIDPVAIHNPIGCFRRNHRQQSLKSPEFLPRAARRPPVSMAGNQLLNYHAALKTALALLLGLYKPAFFPVALWNTGLMQNCPDDDRQPRPWHMAGIH